LRKKLKICFDIDGVICNNTWGKYENAKPHKLAIEKINKLYSDGNTIILFTSRYMGFSDENIDLAKERGYDFTFNQMIKWGVKFHRLIMGKPSYDLIIDDKQFNYSDDWIVDI
jgi:uncharacterized HAD superfamily protein